jgi:hypothetical protein
MQLFGYYDSRGTYADDFAEQAAQGARQAWIYVAPGIETYVAAKVRAAQAAGLTIILNLQGIVWDLETMTIRPTAVLDWQRLAASIGDLWPSVVGFYHADEPFHHAGSKGRDKKALAGDLRLVNEQLALLKPRVRRLCVLAWLELEPSHASAVPEVARDAWGFTDVGFCHYSEEDGSPLCDTRASYYEFFDRLRAACPNARRLLVPDGAMFSNDTIEAKLDRIDWICELVDEPDVDAVIPYLWSARRTEHVTHDGLKEHPRLLARYAALSHRLSGGNRT